LDGRGVPFLTFTGMSLPGSAGGATGAAGAVPAATGVNPSLDVTLTNSPPTRVAWHEPRRQCTDGFEPAGDPSVAPAGTAPLSVWRPVTPTAPRRAATASSPTMRASPWIPVAAPGTTRPSLRDLAQFSGSGRSPIDLAYSDDDGRTWTGPIRISDEGHQFDQDARSSHWTCWPPGELQSPAPQASRAEALDQGVATAVNQAAALARSTFRLLVAASLLPVAGAVRAGRRAWAGVQATRQEGG
jgi:hypothetical protein